jgi:cysteine synthase
VFTFKIGDVAYAIRVANAAAIAQAHALAESEGETVTVSSAQDTLVVCEPTHRHIPQSH